MCLKAGAKIANFHIISKFFAKKISFLAQILCFSLKYDVQIEQNREVIAITALKLVSVIAALGTMPKIGHVLGEHEGQAEHASIAEGQPGTILCCRKILPGQKPGITAPSEIR